MIYQIRVGGDLPLHGRRRLFPVPDLVLMLVVARPQRAEGLHILDAVEYITKFLHAVNCQALDVLLQNKITNTVR